MQISGFGVFIVVITLLLTSWSLVTFWQRFLENLAYNTLKLDPDDTWISLLLAIATTAVFLTIVWVIKSTGVIPNLDYLIYDYQEEPGAIDEFGTSLGGPLGRPRYRGKSIGKRISPRGALSAVLNPVSV